MKVSKEEVLKLMVQDDGENCLVYVLQRVEEIVASINYKDGKWYYELCNDYQDYSIYKKYIEEDLALSFFNTPSPLDSEMEEILKELEGEYDISGFHIRNKKTHNKLINTIRQALVDYKSKTVATNIYVEDLENKLDKIEEVVNRITKNVELLLGEYIGEEQFISTITNCTVDLIQILKEDTNE